MSLVAPDYRPYFLVFDELSPYLAEDDCLDWSKLFVASNATDNAAKPVELDVGCGRGMFLFNASTTRPETNFLGAEVDFHEARRGAKRLLKRTQPNARVVGGDVNYLLDKRIRAASLAAVHVYFPDPWWKRKHRRRRLFTDLFADRVARVLQPNGFLHMWTDVADYFEIVAALMDHHPLFVKQLTPEERPAAHDLDYTTGFERSRRLAGLPIHRGLWQRR
ncbi:MAG: tRNA (guanine-N7)-methyltransferase [Planctomycetia bacterium]|nr:tRNA (guanine-N7)-methyltransferase [Planctomycetia bacterium]